MAITNTHHDTNHDNTNSATYTTASITPTANSLQLLWVLGQNGTQSNAEPSSITGAGLTFVQIGTGSVNCGNNRWLTLWRELDAAPSTGTLTITFPATNGFCIWSWSEFDGIDTSGTSGSGAIVQNVTNNSPVTQATTGSVTLASFGSSNNRAAAGFAIGQRNNTFTAGTDFAIIGQSGTTEVAALASEWRSDAEDTLPDITWTQSSTWGGHAVEIKAEVVSGTSLVLPHRLHRNTLLRM